MRYYLDNVLNPEYLSGLTKKYKIKIHQRGRIRRRAEIHVLAVNEAEAKKFVSAYDTLYSHLNRIPHKIDWDENSDNIELVINEIEEVKE